MTEQVGPNRETIVWLRKFLADTEGNKDPFVVKTRGEVMDYLQPRGGSNGK